MRKVLSIVLALAMVLGCFASVFAATYTDVKADADYATAIDVLSDLGVVSGYTDGTYRPEKVVSRAEMAALLVKALGLTPAKSATTNFSDVPATHWAAGYVAYANTLGIIAGYTDGTFKPDRTVSYDEAITMIISALGYKAEALEGTTWPTAYILKAQQLKITKGVELLGSTGANRGDIASLLYNTLGKEIGKTNKDGEFKPTAGDTMFARLGADDTDTVVVTELGADSQTIVALYDSKIDLDEYFGAEIEVILNGDSEVIAVTDENTTFVEGKVDTAKTKVGDTKYTTAADPTAPTYTFLNGAAGGATVDGETYKFAVKTNTKGEITEFVSAQYWEGTTFQAAADVKADAVKLDGKDLPTKDGKLDTTGFEIVGVDAIGDIKEDAVVTYYQAGGTGKIVKVEVSTETVIGKITKITSGKATINGKAYAAPAAPDFSKEYIVYLDYAGDQFGATQEYSETAYESEYAYGVVLAAGYTETKDTFDATVGTRQVKLVDETGAEVVLTVNKDANAALLADQTETFKGSITKGVFVQYKLNDKDEVVKMEAVTAFDISGTDVAVKNGMVSAKAISSSVLVFAYDNTDMSKAKITVANTIADGKYTSLKGIVNEKKQVALIYVGPETGAGAGTTVYGIYTGVSQTGTEKFELTFFVDGAETVYAYEGASAPTFAEPAGTLLTVALTDGAYTSKTAFTGAKLTPTITTKGAFTGTTFVANAGAFDAVIAADAVYYMVDGTKVTVSDQETFVKATGAIALYDTSKTADDIYDVVVFAKPAE